MRCLDCGSNIIEKIGILRLKDDIIGAYIVNNVRYLKCSHCGDLLYPGATLRAIEARKNSIKEQLIKKLPIDEFVGATEAALILGISRQAIHKHRRIRRGFIYSIKFEGRIIYHRKSIELFKDRGDGRFPLFKQQETPEVKFVICGAGVSGEQFFTETEITGEKKLINWFTKKHKMIGQHYAD